MQALSPLRLLDLTHMISGPYASMLLADLGMDILKIETPGKGEITRTLQAHDPQNRLHGMGAHFLTLNRNKQSLTSNTPRAAPTMLPATPSNSPTTPIPTPPRLGEHTATILCQLLSNPPQEIAELKAQGIIWVCFK
jgi:crotonobetainyl-CoA:carnitine CoA-transferase CaiB-like acyl-CoA transferase